MCVKQLGVAYEGVLKQGGTYLLAMCVFLRSGVEKRVKFWQDRWCGDLYFEELYLTLYSLVVDQEAFIVSYLKGNINESEKLWDFWFISQIND